jgi:hypothetical protein
MDYIVVKMVVFGVRKLLDNFKPDSLFSSEAWIDSEIKSWKKHFSE